MYSSDRIRPFSDSVQCTQCNAWMQEVCGEGGDILRVRGDAGQPGEPVAAVRAVVEGRGGGGGGRGGAGHRGLQGAA